MGSVRLDRLREPQRDLVRLRPQPDFYAFRFPGPSDILLLIEIAESLPQCPVPVDVLLAD